jgi:general secretion pathway protein D
VPLSDILGYVIAQTNLQYTVEDYAVYLRPSIDEGETLTVRTFLVPPNFFEGSTLKVTLAATTDSQPTTVANVTIPVQQALTDKGIRFPAGATATFLPGSSKLVVRDTPEQLDLIANLIDQLSQESPQVQIEAKVAEFNQDAIKALSFNYTVGTSLLSHLGVSTFLRTPDYISRTGFGGLTPDNIDTLVSDNPDTSSGVTVGNPLTGGSVANNAPNELTIGAVIDGTGLAAIIEAINNLQGVSLLSAPSVTTQNGLKANIDIVQEFPYPTSFDKPKLSNSSNIAYSSGTDDDGNVTAGLPLVLAIPPTPREFVTQDVGVSLEVKPTTYPDQRIDLDITKAQVLDFDGFIDYGVPIVTRLEELSPPATDEGEVLTLGTINQPVFNLRSMVTNLQVLDGQTAVLGGLTREDTQEINDKVPVLGDIPLVGRLFQSKVAERTKKDLIFFITARLIRSNGKPQYVKTLNAEPEEEALPEPDQQIGPGGSSAPLPEETPNS